MQNNQICSDEKKTNESDQNASQNASQNIILMHSFEYFQCTYVELLNYKSDMQVFESQLQIGINSFI